MTTWQWKVILAIVRYILRKENTDMPSINEFSLNDEDLNILIDAHIRSLE